ncbi:single-stranded-DNA-specific exonuclease RecJ [Leuconostocaceae bacterium ESL0723]|nr:single-stranded-DNA-specific exonuclease RecJ [Leuconostocaceae bacterium ESL0723]
MSHRKWQVMDQPDPAARQALVDNLNISPLLAGILVQKGYDTVAKAQSFLNPSIADLHDPMDLHQMDVAIERLQAAVFGGEKILVYGDYDLDGVTSTAIMVEALTLLGAEVQSYIPNRFEDGYGPSLAKYQALVEEGIDLIVTVDNGVSGYEAVEYAQNHGVDVIITDHHSLPDQLPPAFAIVHPRHPDSQYPAGSDLSGAGVAFKVAQALLSDGQPVESQADLPTELLDLVALGELADMVAVTDENRALITWGLEQLTQMPRPGIKALLKNAKQGKDEPVLSETVAFKIAPRMNAVGRLGQADLALDLLLAQTSDEAQVLADKIEGLNGERQAIVEEVFAAAKQQALTAEQADQQVLIIAGEDWHQGILGIVASRLVDLVKRPVVVLSQHDGAYKGSGRSFGDFDLHQFMAQYQDLYENFGGHQGALGLTINPANLATLKERVSQDSQALDFQAPAQQVNAILAPGHLQESIYADLMRLEPFGTGNQRPVFGFENPKILGVLPLGSTHQHLKLKIGDGQQVVEAVGFNHPEWLTIAWHHQPLDLTATIGLNCFRGQKNLQLLLTDVSLAAEDQQSGSKSDQTQQVFGQVYRFICGHPELNFAQKLPAVADQFALEVRQLKIIIQVFVDLDFISIHQGYIAVNPSPDKQPLTASITYQRYVQVQGR